MPNHIKIRLYSCPLLSLRLSVIVCVAVLLMVHASVSSAQSITWKLFLNSSDTSPILEQSTTSGERFYIDSSDIAGTTYSSEDLLEALDGVSFSLDQSPVIDPLTLHIILKVQGNKFQSVIGVDVMIYFELEAYVNGSRQNDSDFFRNAPLRMIIPAAGGLDYLLELCDAVRNDIIFANYEGGKLIQNNIKTISQVQGIVAEISGLKPVVGGKCTDFGLPAAVQYSTWFKVKKLFE